MADLRAMALDWAKAEDLKPEHAVLLHTDRLQFSTQQIGLGVATMGGILNIMRRDKEEMTYVLCDHSRPVTSTRTTVTVTVEGKQVTFQRVPVQLDETGEYTASERVCLAELKAPAKGDSFAMALAYSAHYRKLRYFSGVSAPPKDEVDFDTWTLHAEGQMEEWGDIPDSESRRRLKESLRSPALEVIEDLLKDKKDVTAKDYLQALHVAFGSTETEEDVAIRLYTMTQGSGERPSSFLTRLQKTLKLALKKNAISEEIMDSVRLKQFVKGLIHDDILLVNLRLRERFNSPPKYINLLEMVRKQEMELQLRNDQRNAGKSAHAKQAASIQSIQPSDAVLQRIQALELETQQLRRSFVTPTQSAAVNSAQAQSSPPAPVQHQYSNTQDNSRRPNFCFKCGEEGHIQRRCPNASNDHLVKQKLLKIVLPSPSNNSSQGNGKGRRPTGNSTSDKSN